MRRRRRRRRRRKEYSRKKLGCQWMFNYSDFEGGGIVRVRVKRGRRG